MILYSDPGGARIVWQLYYTDLATSDVVALQMHFNSCVGPLHAFTFIDPTDNMLLSSSDLGAAPWQISTLIHLVSGMADPDGGSAAFLVSNTGQANQEITQTLAVPANYQYCFSAYAISDQPSMLTLIRRSAAAEEDTAFSIGPSWSRIVSSGKLDDPATNFTVAIRLTPGQQVQLYGLQLEAQLAPSRYRPTAETGGVYSDAHWGVDQLTLVAEAPNLFSTAFSIESAL